MWVLGLTLTQGNEMKEKRLYVGDFNWFGEVHTFYRHALSPRHAHSLMTLALAEVLGRAVSNVRLHFRKKNNYRIKEVRDAKAGLL